MRNIVVVGASLAGLHAAVAIRRADFEGTITVVGDEPHYPYDRPPLSKDFLAGSTEAEALRLRAAADPAETGVEWELGRRAVALRLADGDDRDDRGKVGGGAGTTGGTITLDDGRVLEAD
ncbi:MAG: FAD-dependent oxidoreductase, partial [Actinomycetota bacterium]